MKISNETKVGALTAVAIVLFILGFNFLKGSALWERGRTFYVEYEKAPGLKVSGPIQYNGVQIGRVKDKYLKEDHSGKVMVRFSINHDIPLPVDTRAKIISSDLLGDKAIELFPGKSSIMASNRDTLPGAIQADLTEEIRQELAPIKARLESMIGQVDTAIQVISGLLGENTSDNLDRSLSSVSHTLETFDRTATRIDNIVANQAITIDSIFSNVEVITQTIADKESEIRNILDNLSSMSDSLAKVNLAEVLENASSAIDDLSALVAGLQQGEGSMGKLIKDDQLYNNLADASANLDSLLYVLRTDSRQIIPPLIQIGGKKKQKKE